MFDKMIESRAAGTGKQTRSRYFAASSVVVTSLLILGTVVSIFAEEIILVNGGFDMNALVTPAEMAPPAPEPKQQRSSAPAAKSDVATTTRIVNMARTDESRFVPNEISTTANQYKARPTGSFTVGKADTDRSGGAAIDRGTNGPGDGDGLLGADTGDKRGGDEVKDKTPVAPPEIKKAPAANVIKSLGVVNSLANYLPKPAYPPPAKMTRTAGSVKVEILISESGSVISASAIDGPPLLRSAAVNAARQAKFTPTYLSNVPVKAKGVIVYNFVL